MHIALRERGKYILITVGVFVLNCAFDRLTKVLAFRLLRGKGLVKVLGDFMVLIYTENGGAFLSLGEQWPVWVKYGVLLIIPMSICLAALGYLMLKEPSLRRLIPGSCIIGGGLGNLIDRLLNDFKVIDFLNVGIGGLRTGVLNAADLSVTFGVLALLLGEFTMKQRDKGL